jgi:LacI family transcriptional regulator
MMLYTSESAAEGIRMAKSWLVEGIIVLGGLADGCSLFMRKTNIPLVFIDAYFHDDGLPYVNVGLEDRRGAFLMTEYLIHKGHRRIAFFVDGNPVAGSGLERLSGYRDALRQYKLPVYDEDYIPISYKYTERHDFLREFARSRLKNYSALFFFSDFYAVDALTFFSDMNIRVPGDISICGFDGNIFASQCRPRLTTVRQVVSDKAIQGVAQLFRLIRKEPLENRIIRLGVSLSEGDSVKTLR